MYLTPGQVGACGTLEAQAVHSPDLFLSPPTDPRVGKDDGPFQVHLHAYQVGDAVFQISLWPSPTLSSTSTLTIRNP